MRPIDAEAREMLRYPAPREVEEILEEIDGIRDMLEAWNRIQFEQRFDDVAPEERERRSLQRYELEVQFVNLLAELQEAGYEGERLHEYVRWEIGWLYSVYDAHYTSMNFVQSVWWQIRERYKGTDLAILARLQEMDAAIELLYMHSMQVSDHDLQELADWQINRPDLDIAGDALLRGIQTLDKPDQDRWCSWVLANLPPESRAASSMASLAAEFEPMEIRLLGTDFDGQPIDTHNWLGDVILVDFWGTWCGPCIAGMPEIKEVRDRFSDQGLRVVGVCVDADLEGAKRFLAENQYDWPQLVEDPGEPRFGSFEHSIARQYDIRVYPTLWLIDRAGTARALGRRGVLAEQVQEYLAEPAPATNR